MITIQHQDSEIIVIDNYTWKGVSDKIYLRSVSFIWAYSTIGNNYKVLIDRKEMNMIYVKNEFYELRYSQIEPQLTGDVLLLGLGFGIIDQFLASGTSWKWVERNAWLVDNVIPVHGTVHKGDAMDEDFLKTLGTFDTIFIDVPQTKLIDFESLLNVGGTIVNMTI